MKFKTAISVTLVIGTLLGGVNSPQMSQGQISAKIGLLIPLSGDLRSRGPSIQNGAEMAIDDLNALQSVYTFELVVNDTGTDASKSIDLANSLISADVFGVVGAASSSVTIGTSQVLATAGIPQISYASSNPDITTADDDDFLFRLVPSDSIQGKATAQFADYLNISNIAILGIDNQYGEVLAEGFATEFKILGGEILLNLTYNFITTTDYEGPVRQLVDTQAEAVYIVAYLSDGSAIINELEHQNYNGTIFGTDNIATESIYIETDFDPKAAEGVYSLSPLFNTTESFNQAYKDLHGNSPWTFEAESYDATMLLGLAAIEAGSVVGTEVRDKLRAVDDTYMGASGRITFDINGDRIGGKYHISRFSENKLKIIGFWVDGNIDPNIANPGIISGPIDFEIVTITEDYPTITAGKGNLNSSDPTTNVLNVSSAYLYPISIMILVGLYRRKEN